MPTLLQLLAYTLILLAIRVPIGAQGTGDAEMAYRLELATACIEATTDRTERYICAKIARFESAYREDVGRCTIKGKEGEITAWQIIPRTKKERERLCQSLVEDARFMLERVRESRAACRHLPKNEQLALYTRGDCASVEGRKLSLHRFPTDAEARRVEREFR